MYRSKPFLSLSHTIRNTQLLTKARSSSSVDLTQSACLVRARPVDGEIHSSPCESKNANDQSRLITARKNSSFHNLSEGIKKSLHYNCNDRQRKDGRSRYVSASCTKLDNSVKTCLKTNAATRNVPHRFEWTSKTRSEIKIDDRKLYKSKSIVNLLSDEYCKSIQFVETDRPVESTKNSSPILQRNFKSEMGLYNRLNFSKSYMLPNIKFSRPYSTLKTVLSNAKTHVLSKLTKAVGYIKKDANRSFHDVRIEDGDNVTRNSEKVSETGEHNKIKEKSCQIQYENKADDNNRTVCSNSLDHKDINLPGSKTEKLNKKTELIECNEKKSVQTAQSTETTNLSGNTNEAIKETVSSMTGQTMLNQDNPVCVAKDVESTGDVVESKGIKVVDNEAKVESSETETNKTTEAENNKVKLANLTVDCIQKISKTPDYQSSRENSLPFIGNFCNSIPSKRNEIEMCNSNTSSIYEPNSCKGKALMPTLLPNQAYHSRRAIDETVNSENDSITVSRNIVESIYTSKTVNIFNAERKNPTEESNLVNVSKSDKKEEQKLSLPSCDISNEHPNEKVCVLDSSLLAKSTNDDSIQKCTSSDHTHQSLPTTTDNENEKKILEEKESINFSDDGIYHDKYLETEKLSRIRSFFQHCLANYNAIVSNINNVKLIDGNHNLPPIDMKNYFNKKREMTMSNLNFINSLQLSETQTVFLEDKVKTTDTPSKQDCLKIGKVELLEKGTSSTTSVDDIKKHNLNTSSEQNSTGNAYVEDPKSKNSGPPKQEEIIVTLRTLKSLKATNKSNMTRTRVNHLTCDNFAELTKDKSQDAHEDESKFNLKDNKNRQLVTLNDSLKEDISRNMKSSSKVGNSTDSKFVNLKTKSNEKVAINSESMEIPVSTKNNTSESTIFKTKEKSNTQITVNDANSTANDMEKPTHTKLEEKSTEDSIKTITCFKDDMGGSNVDVKANTVKGDNNEEQLSTTNQCREKDSVNKNDYYLEVLDHTSSNHKCYIDEIAEQSDKQPRFLDSVVKPETASSYEIENGNEILDELLTQVDENMVIDQLKASTCEVCEEEWYVGKKLRPMTQEKAWQRDKMYSTDKAWERCQTAGNKKAWKLTPLKIESKRPTVSTVPWELHGESVRGMKAWERSTDFGVAWNKDKPLPNAKVEMETNANEKPWESQTSQRTNKYPRTAVAWDVTKPYKATTEVPWYLNKVDSFVTGELKNMRSRVDKRDRVNKEHSYEIKKLKSLRNIVTTPAVEHYDVEVLYSRDGNKTPFAGNQNSTDVNIVNEKDVKDEKIDPNSGRYNIKSCHVYKTKRTTEKSIEEAYDTLIKQYAEFTKPVFTYRNEKLSDEKILDSLKTKVYDEEMKTDGPRKVPKRGWQNICVPAKAIIDQINDNQLLNPSLCNDSKLLTSKKHVPKMYCSKLTPDDRKPNSSSKKYKSTLCWSQNDESMMSHTVNREPAVSECKTTIDDSLKNSNVLTTSPTENSKRTYNNFDDCFKGMERSVLDESLDFTNLDNSLRQECTSSNNRNEWADENMGSFLTRLSEFAEIHGFSVSNQLLKLRRKYSTESAPNLNEEVEYDYFINYPDGLLKNTLKRSNKYNFEDLIARSEENDPENYPLLDYFEPENRNKIILHKDKTVDDELTERKRVRAANLIVTNDNEGENMIPEFFSYSVENSGNGARIGDKQDFTSNRKKQMVVSKVYYSTSKKLYDKNIEKVKNDAAGKISQNEKTPPIKMDGDGKKIETYSGNTVSTDCAEYDLIDSKTHEERMAELYEYEENLIGDIPYVNGPSKKKAKEQKTTKAKTKNSNSETGKEDVKNPARCTNTSEVKASNVKEENLPIFTKIENKNTKEIPTYTKVRQIGTKSVQDDVEHYASIRALNIKESGIKHYHNTTHSEIMETSSEACLKMNENSCALAYSKDNERKDSTTQPQETEKKADKVGSAVNLPSQSGKDAKGSKDSKSNTSIGFSLDKKTSEKIQSLKKVQDEKKYSGKQTDEYARSLALNKSFFGRKIKPVGDLKRCPCSGRRKGKKDRRSVTTKDATDNELEKLSSLSLPHLKSETLFKNEMDGTKKIVSFSLLPEKSGARAIKAAAKLKNAHSSVNVTPTPVNGKDSKSQLASPQSPTIQKPLNVKVEMEIDVNKKKITQSSVGVSSSSTVQKENLTTKSMRKSDGAGDLKSMASKENNTTNVVTVETDKDKVQPFSSESTAVKNEVPFSQTSEVKLSTKESVEEKVPEKYQPPRPIKREPPQFKFLMKETFRKAQKVEKELSNTLPSRREPPQLRFLMKETSRKAPEVEREPSIAVQSSQSSGEKETPLKAPEIEREPSQSSNEMKSPKTAVVKDVPSTRYFEESKEKETPAGKLASSAEPKSHEALSTGIKSILQEYKKKYKVTKTNDKIEVHLSEENFPLINEKKFNYRYPAPNAKVMISNYKDSAILSYIPSVSQVLDDTLPQPSKDALHQWEKDMVGQLGQNGYYKYYRDKLEDDKKFHHLIRKNILGEKIDKWEESTTNKTVMNSLKSLQGVLTMVSNATVVECPVVHPHLPYHGIIDCVARYNGKPVLIEWKQADSRKPLLQLTYDAPVQLCAYLGAFNYDESYKVPVEAGLIVIAYTDGTPADVFHLTRNDCIGYWRVWLLRLQKYLSNSTESALLL